MSKAGRIHDHQAPIADVSKGPKTFLSTDCKRVNAETCRSIKQLTLRSRRSRSAPIRATVERPWQALKAAASFKAVLVFPPGPSGKGSPPTQHVLFRHGDAITAVQDCVQRSFPWTAWKRFNEAPSQRPIQGHTLKSINQRRPIRSLTCIFTTIKRSEFPAMSERRPASSSTMDSIVELGRCISEGMRKFMWLFETEGRV